MVRKGIDCEGIAQKELDHFGNCPVYGAFVDMRDLARVLAHTHGEKIPFFIDDEPLPAGLLPS